MRFCLFRCTLLLMLLETGCQTTNRTAEQPSNPIQHASFEHPHEKTIYVVGHGWHTGLVLKTSDVSPELFPEVRDFTDTQFIELGWGDEGFYRADKITAPLVMRAALWPTPSVLHVAGFYQPVEDVFVVSDIVEVRLSPTQFDRMCRFVGDTLERDPSGESEPLGPGKYGESAFYRSKGSYYFPKTCNVWTAQALKEADCAVNPLIATTAENVLSQTRKIGRVVQKSHKGLKKAALGGSE